MFLFFLFESNSFLLLCLSDFSSLRDAGFVVVADGVPSLSVSIGDSSVRGVLKYSLSVSRDSKSYSIDTFYSDISVSLKDFYELASVITKEACESNFI